MEIHREPNMVDELTEIAINNQNEKMSTVLSSSFHLKTIGSDRIMNEQLYQKVCTEWTKNLLPSRIYRS